LREKLLERVRTAIEWKCVFCGEVNPRKARRCDSCNAPRPFLYDVMGDEK